MVEPRLYIEPSAKIVHYKAHKLYTAGVQARVKAHVLIGIKNGKIVRLEDPESIPYLIITNKSSRRGYAKYYAVTEDNYYDIDGSYDWHSKKNSFEVSEKRSRTKLTTLHQAVAKRVIDDYLKEKIEGGHIEIASD